MENSELLITIILYLLLALAFFSRSNSSGKKDNGYDNELILVFIFGIISLISLFLSYINNLLLMKYLGYAFTGSFVIVFLYFLTNKFCLAYLGYRFIDCWKDIPLILVNSRVVFSALMVFLIIIGILLKIKIIFLTIILCLACFWIVRKISKLQNKNLLI